jgi:uncharacterized membrane protein
VSSPESPGAPGSQTSVLVVPEREPPTPARPGLAQEARRYSIGPLAAIAAIDIIANLRPVAGLNTGTIGLLSGIFLCLLSPALLLRPVLEDAVPSPLRLIVAVGAAALAVMVFGLAMNVLLPPLGVSRPLAPVPATLCADLVTLACVALLVLYGRRQQKTWRIVSPGLWRSRPSLFAWLVCLTSLAVLLSVGGSIRLNNGGGDLVALSSMGLVTVLIGLLVVRGHRLADPEIAVVLWGLSAAILLLTALRGWFVTGPDAQGEYAAFHAVTLAGHWHPTSALSAYNACLSITIFPQMLHVISGISGVSVTKAIIPLLFATTPVLVFSVARSFASRRVAIASAVVFLTFPTFVYSMPYAARQEMGFFYVGIAVAISRLPQTRTTAVVLYSSIVGMLLSHYSTSYLFAGTIVVGYLADMAMRYVAARRPPSVDVSDGASPSTTGPVRANPFGLRVIASLLIGIAIWNGAINGITGHLSAVVSGAATGSSNPFAATVDDPALASKGVRVSGSKPLVTYGALEEAEASLGPQRTGVYPQSELHNYTVAQASIVNLPLSAVGRFMDRAGVSPNRANALIRSLLKRALQLFAIAGVLLFLRRFREPQGDFGAFALGSLVAVGTVFAVPAFSQNYGSARAFQQALFGLAPCVALAVRDLVRVLKRPAATYAIGAASLISVSSLTGFLPQLTGGYVAQLDLSNSGVFYAEYYTTPQELAAAQWLNTTYTGPDQMNRYLANRLATVLTQTVINDDFPDGVRVRASVLLGSVPTQLQVDPAYGQLFYTYPLSFLATSKSLVYASSGAKVYR